MVVIAKTKSQMRAELESAVAEFQARGGVVEVIERKVRARKQVMRGKSSKGFVTGTSGFANGFPRRTGIVG